MGVYNTEQVRKKYPNALIVGVLKELAANYRNRVEFFKTCDKYVLPIIDKNWTRFNNIARHRYYPFW